MNTISKQNKIILVAVLAVILLSGVVYVQLSNTTLNTTGTEIAESNGDFKVYYTGNVIKEETSEAYIKIETSPTAKTKSATVNILGLAKKDDYGYAILEIENESSNIDALSVEVNTSIQTFNGNEELFNIDVIMCDINGTQTSNSVLKSGEKTYVKILAKLLKTPINYQETTITVKIIATKEGKEPIDDLNLPKGENDYLYSYYDRAERELRKLTLEEKIAQMYIIGGSKFHFNNLAKYKFGGYLFFADFFKNKNISTVSTEIAGYQTAVKNLGGLPLLTSIDEEGNTVSRLRSSGFLAANGYSDFLNSNALYATKDDGSPNWTPIEEDVLNKSNLLEKIGINLNFAPDVDISDDTNSYIYNRTLGQNAIITGEYASRVIMASKNTKVTYSLKHFPGYGNSGDTHNSIFELDTRTRAEFDSKDLIPFQEGIASGAECIIVSHNIVACMDDQYPCSISRNVHDVLRNELGYTNIIISDDINMGAIHTNYTYRDAIIRAINAGNDMICISLNGNQEDKVVSNDGTYDTLSYAKLISYVADAVNSREVSVDTINLAVRRIIAWKMYKGLM